MEQQQQMKESPLLQATNASEGQGGSAQVSWLELRENAGSAASNVMDIVFTFVSQETHRRYLERIALPFAVESCVKELCAVVALDCLTHDPGEREMNGGLPPEWLPDDEPIPAPIDSWARNTVPERELSQRTGLQQMSETTQDTSQIHSQTRKLKIKRPVKQTTADQVQTQQTTNSVSTTETKITPIKQPPKRVRVVHPKVATDLGTTPEDQKTPQQQSQQQRSETKMPKDFTFSHTGDVIALAPIPPEKLPPTISQVRAVIVEENHAPSQTNAQQTQKLQQRNADALMGRGRKSIHKTAGKTKKRPDTTGDSGNVIHFMPESGAPPPPLIDSIKLAPGVTVREGSRVRYSGSQSQSQQQSNPTGLGLSGIGRSRATSAPSSNEIPLGTMFPPISGLPSQQQQQNSKPGKIRAKLPLETIT